MQIMEHFELNDKKYLIEVEHHKVITITECDNSQNGYIFSSDELKELLIETEKLTGFHCKKKVFTNKFVNNIEFCQLTNTDIMLTLIDYDLGRHLLQIPLNAFCHDLLELFLDEKREKVISEAMPSFHEALDAWRAKSDFIFIQGNCLIYNATKQLVGIGYFKDETLIALSKDNLSLYKEVILCFKNKAIRTLIERVTSYSDILSSYCLDEATSSGTQNFMTVTEKEAINRFDLTNHQKHQTLIDYFDFTEIGKAKSHLDNFFDI